MTCHLFLDNFLRFYDLWVVFKGLKVFETKFSFKKTQISQFWYHELFVFSESCLCERRFIAENWLCFRACNSRIVTYDQEFVLWCDFCVLITITESFEKFSFKKSWCCRKHVFVFEIVSLKDLNKFWSNYLFPLTCWVKRFVHRYGKSLKTFPFWELTFWVKPFEKVLMFSLFLDTS